MAGALPVKVSVSRHHDPQKWNLDHTRKGCHGWKAVLDNGVQFGYLNYVGRVEPKEGIVEEIKEFMELSGYELGQIEWNQ